MIAPPSTSPPPRLLARAGSPACRAAAPSTPTATSTRRRPASRACRRRNGNAALDGCDVREPCRLVPLADADQAPATRGAL